MAWIIGTSRFVTGTTTATHFEILDLMRMLSSEETPIFTFDVLQPARFIRF